MNIEQDNWVRVFDIADTSKHKKGYTIYKVVSIVYPKTCSEASIKLTVWKRFNDFKRLHKCLKTRHEEFQIDDIFPPLISSTYFKRFKTEIIEQRKHLILSFLEYVARHPSLFTTVEFVKFFESSHTPEVAFNSSINMIRAELHLPDEPEYSSVQENYSEEEDVESDSASVTTLSSCNTSGQGSDIFSESKSSMTSLVKLLRRLGSDQSSTPGKLSTRNSCESLHTCTMSSDSLSVVDSANNCSPLPLASVQSDLLSIMPGSQVNLATCPKYLTSAAQFIAEAVDFELRRQYADAFGAYKNGIACLLNGVADDVDASRKQMVRRKVETYLSKAEKIYNNFLAPSIVEEISSSIRNLEYLKEKPLHELSLYHVAKVVNDGLVVLNVENKNLYFLKAYPKLSNGDRFIFHKNVPFMVRALNYFSTDNSYFVVLQYNSAGTLWDALSKNLTSIEEINIETENFELLDSDSASESSYSELVNSYRSSNDTQEKAVKNGDKSNGADSAKTVKSEKHDEEIVNSEKAVGHKRTRNQSSMSSAVEEFVIVDELQPINLVMKWAAQLVIAIDSLHMRGVIIGTLDPYDLLLTEDKNLLLTYKCDTKYDKRLRIVENSHFLYYAPEWYYLSEITTASDWWSFGVILFELLTGTPLYYVHPDGIHDYTILKVPKFVHPEGKSLLKELLVFDPSKRLGNGCSGTDILKAHAFFDNIDWNAIMNDFTEQSYF